MEGHDRLVPGEDPEIVSLFVEQAEEMVGLVRRHLERVEGLVQAGAWEIMRMVHRFKGDAQFLQLPACYQLAQALERSCQQVFERPGLPSHEAIRVLREGLSLVERRCTQPTKELLDDENSYIRQASI